MIRQKILIFTCLWGVLLSGCAQPMASSVTPTHPSNVILSTDVPLQSTATLRLTTPSALSETPVPEQSHVCIGDMEDFAWAPPSDEFDLLLSQEVAPQAPWQLYTKFERADNERFFELHLAREKEGNTELWIFFEVTSTSLVPSYHYFLLSPEDGQIERISAKVVDNSGVFVSQLFLAQDGSVWGVNEPNVHKDEHLKTPIPVLSKFNEATRQFEFALNAPQVISDGVLGFHTFAFENNIVLDQKDRFWIHVQGEGVYRYDLAAEELELVFEDESPYFSEFASSRDGNLYLYQWSGLSTVQSGEIWKYDPERDILQSVSSDPEVVWPWYPTMLVDQRDRVNGMVGHPT